MEQRFAFLCGFVVLSIFLIGVAEAQETSLRQLFLLVVSVLQLAGFASYWFFCKSKNDSLLSRMKPMTQLSPKNQAIASGIVIGLLIFLLMYLTEKSETTISIISISFIWWSFYYLVLIALTEELIFRGVCFKIFRQDRIKAVGASSVLFALYHLNVGAHALPYYFAMGLLFGVMRYFSMSLVSLTIVHGCFNLFVSVVWPVAEFRHSELAFYVVAPVALIAITALVGWLLSEFLNNPHSTEWEVIPGVTQLFQKVSAMRTLMQSQGAIQPNSDSAPNQSDLVRDQ